jgi:hypothetical protein
MQWMKFSQYNLPPQGLKILCFRQGDLWIARRFECKGKSVYLEISYGGENGSILTDIPEYWMQLDLPDGYTGYMRIGIEDHIVMTMDEYQQNFPKEHEEFVTMIIESAKNAVPGH